MIQVLPELLELQVLLVVLDLLKSRAVQVRQDHVDYRDLLAKDEDHPEILDYRETLGTPANTTRVNYTAEVQQVTSYTNGIILNF